MSCRPHADAALLVLPARRERRSCHDRRRPHSDGTEAHFDRFLALSPAGCSVADWECVRSTSYVYPNNDMTDAQVAAYQAQGFEIALHLNTGLPGLHERLAARDLGRPAGRSSWRAGPTPSLRRARTAPTASPGATGRAQPRWSASSGSDWTRTTTTGRAAGSRTGPGCSRAPASRMRFADRDGSLIDVYQATTQLDRRVGDRTPRAHRGAAGQRARGSGLLRRLHGEHAHGNRDLSGRQRDRRRRAGARRARDLAPSSCSTGSTAATTRRSPASASTGAACASALNPAAGARGLEAMVPRPGPPGGCPA